MKDPIMSPQPSSKPTPKLNRAMADVSTILRGNHNLNLPLYRRVLAESLPVLEQNSGNLEVALLLRELDMRQTEQANAPQSLPPSSLLSDKGAHFVSGNRIGWGR